MKERLTEYEALKNKALEQFRRGNKNKPKFLPHIQF
jgi:hypothetical protein